VTDGQAIVFAARERIELVEIRLPALKPDEVLVQTEVTAVSQGTDRAMVSGSYGGVEDRYPFIYGYSRVGTVAAIGDDVAGVSVGERVFVGMAGTRLDPADGFGEQGGAYTSHAVVHHSEVVRLPPEIDSGTAAVAALAAIPYQGVVVSDVQPNSRVLVVGLGAIGQFSALVSALKGAQVWAADLVESRRQLSARLTGAVPVDPAGDIVEQIERTAWGYRPWRGRNAAPISHYEQQRWAQAAGAVDVVIDATGRSDAFAAYVPLLAREGCLCLQGYYATPLTLDFHPAHLKRIKVCCPGGLDLVDYQTMLRVLSRVDVKELIGLEIPVAEAPARLAELLLGSPSDSVCALIQWRSA
jgi:2-desacetyl-2-hydroxyethyl bacteriochlorophyllide A dehydrogenase